MIKTVTIRLALFLFGINASLATAEVYQWTDENGLLHYSDQAPKGVTVTTATIDTPPSQAASANNPPAAAEPETPPDETFSIQALPPADQEKCDGGKRSLKVLQDGGRIRSRSASGEVTYLTQADIAERIENAKRVIDIYCGQ